jgi:hypothetical protein
MITSTHLFAFIQDYVQWHVIFTILQQWHVNSTLTLFWWRVNSMLTLFWWHVNSMPGLTMQQYFTPVPCLAIRPGSNALGLVVVAFSALPAGSMLAVRLAISGAVSTTSSAHFVHACQLLNV